MRWERTLLLGKVPPFIWAWPARCTRARSVPYPLLPAHGLRALLGLGAPSLSWSLSHGGSRAGVIRGPPRAPAARHGCALLVRGSPFPFPPSAAARVRRGRPFEGGPRHGLSFVGILRSESSLGAPLCILFPLKRRGPALLCSGYSPAP